MKVTEHFSIEEFDCHDGTKYPQEWIDNRLKILCIELELIRSFWGRPVKILSGYRTQEYNTKIGGAPKSQHKEGRASDIQIDGISPKEVHDCILKMIKDGLLKNIKGLGLYKSFVHVDVRPTKELARWDMVD